MSPPTAALLFRVYKIAVIETLDHRFPVLMKRLCFSDFHGAEAKNASEPSVRSPISRLSACSWMTLVLKQCAARQQSCPFLPCLHPPHTTSSATALLLADLLPRSPPAWPSMVTAFTHFFFRPFALAHGSQKVSQEGILHSRFHSSCKENQKFRFSLILRAGRNSYEKINHLSFATLPCPCFSLLSN